MVPAPVVAAVVPAAPASPACTARSHEALKASPASWAALPLAGYQCFATTVLEQRSCPACGSSLYREVKIVAVEYLDQVHQVEGARVAGGAA